MRITAMIAGLAVSMVIASTAVAGDEKYFYSVAQTESDDAAWGYVVPECAALDMAEYKAMQMKNQCAGDTPDAEQCDPAKTVTLKNSLTKKKQSFPLALIVFSSLPACQADRTAHVNGDAGEL